MSTPSQASRHFDYLDHMLEAIKLARSYVEGLSKVDFLADLKLIWRLSGTQFRRLCPIWNSNS